MIISGLPSWAMTVDRRPANRRSRSAASAETDDGIGQRIEGVDDTRVLVFPSLGTPGDLPGQVARGGNLFILDVIAASAG
jgi:hypothetical protein